MPFSDDPRRAPGGPSFTFDDNGVTFLMVCAGGRAVDTDHRIRAEQALGRRVHVIATPTAAQWFDPAGIETLTGWPLRSAMPGPLVPIFEPLASRVLVSPLTLNSLTKWADGHSDNLVIWFTDTIPNTPKASQTFEALALMDQWLMNIRANPGAGIAANKLPRAVDACYDRNGQLMQAGASVWDGILDGRPAGACTQAFPLYRTSRIVAGAPIEGGIYNCARKPVTTAVADGTYGPWTPSAAEIAPCLPASHAEIRIAATVDNACSPTIGRYLRHTPRPGCKIAKF